MTVSALRGIDGVIFAGHIDSTTRLHSHTATTPLLPDHAVVSSSPVLLANTLTAPPGERTVLPDCNLNALAESR
ncbi:MAG: hypothetical protein U1F34_07045 [Gammaproteobacteria bacterium]